MAALAPASGRPGRRRQCICSSKRAGWPTPTATATSPTPTSCRCRAEDWLRCWTRPTSPQRAALIGPQSMGRASPGRPPGLQVAWGSDTSPELPSTSHMSIVDGYGRGRDDHDRGRRVRFAPDGGRLHPQQPADRLFLCVPGRERPDRQPGASRQAAAQRDGADHRVRQESGKLVLLVGSPGGGFIINYVARLLVGTLDWGLDVQQAISLPNFGSRNGPTELERGRVSDLLVSRLKESGHQVRLDEQTSGLQAIMRVRKDGRTCGSAAPIRAGKVSPAATRPGRIAAQLHSCNTNDCTLPCAKTMRTNRQWLPGNHSKVTLPYPDQPGRLSCNTAISAKCLVRSASADTGARVPGHRLLPAPHLMTVWCWSANCPGKHGRRCN